MMSFDKKYHKVEMGVCFTTLLNNIFIIIIIIIIIIINNLSINNFKQKLHDEDSEDYAKRAVSHYETKRNCAVFIDTCTGIGVFILGVVGFTVVIIIARFA